MSLYRSRQGLPSYFGSSSLCQLRWVKNLTFSSPLANTYQYGWPRLGVLQDLNTSLYWLVHPSQPQKGHPRRLRQELLNPIFSQMPTEFKRKRKGCDVWPSNVSHIWNLCSAFHPSKCTHTQQRVVNQHTHTHFVHTHCDHTPEAVGSHCCGIRG